MLEVTCPVSGKLKSVMSQLAIAMHSKLIIFIFIPTLNIGGPSTPGEFQEIDGEPEDRRKARWERHHRTLERAVPFLSLMLDFGLKMSFLKSC